jgi:hypothetical protein
MATQQEKEPGPKCCHLVPLPTQRAPGTRITFKFASDYPKQGRSTLPLEVSIHYFNPYLRTKFRERRGRLCKHEGLSLIPSALDVYICIFKDGAGQEEPGGLVASQFSILHVLQANKKQL